MNYDFESFKKLYGLDNGDKKDENILTPEFMELEKQENEVSLFDELNVYESNNISVPNKEIKKTPIPSPKKNNKVHDNLENTMEIETFDLDHEMKKALEVAEEKKEEKPKKKKKFHLPMTTSKDHHLEYAFAHCAVLGFITAAMGSGMLIYILNHMNNL